MLRDFLNYLKGKEEPGTTVVYDCDPLVIVDDEDQILYSGRTNVDFTPSTLNNQQGVAIVQTKDPSGWQPKLNVDQRIDVRINPDPDIRSRGGLTWLGTDDESKALSWYVGRAADTYLLNREQK